MSTVTDRGGLAGYCQCLYLESCTNAIEQSGSQGMQKMPRYKQYSLDRYDTSPFLPMPKGDLCVGVLQVIDEQLPLQLAKQKVASRTWECGLGDSDR